MLRAALAGLSLLTLAAACDTMPDGKGGGVNPSHATSHVAVPIQDKYATSADGTKIHYLASGKGQLVVMITAFRIFRARGTS